MYKYVPLSLSMRDSIIYMDVVAKASAPKIAFLITDLDSETASANLYIENDGNLVYNSCTREGELFVYTPTINSFPKVGLSKCQLQVVIDSRVAYSFVIFVNVRENIVNDSAIEAQDEFGALEEAIRTVGQYDSRIQKNSDDIASIDSEIVGIKATSDSTIARLDNAIVTLDDLSDEVDTLSPLQFPWAATGSTEPVVSVPTGTWTTIAEVPLDPGVVYLLDFCGRFDTNVNGVRALCLSTTPNARNFYAVKYYNAIRASSNSYTMVNLMKLFYWSQTQAASYNNKLYLTAYQDSGSALNIIPRLSGVRILNSISS